MEHPKMFDDDDPVLARVRAIALGFLEAKEKVSHGRPVFFTTKIFAHYGGSEKLDGEWVPHSQSVMVKADLLGQEQLRQRPESFVPAYIGGAGWTGLDLSEDTDWGEIAELIEDSYRLTAPARLVRHLSARHIDDPTT